MKKATAAEAPANPQPKEIVIKPLSKGYVTLEIEGISDLIQNCFSQKSMEQMLSKHMGSNMPKEVKKPRDVLEASKILNVDGVVCIPPAAVKKAMLSAAQAGKSHKKADLRVQLWIDANSIPITYKEYIPRLDIVRLATGTPDVRFRASYSGWKARVAVAFDTKALSVQAVVDLLNRAGEVGLLEWRPEKNGTYGRFMVSRAISDPKEIMEVRKSCTPQLKSLHIPPWALDLDLNELDTKLLARIAVEGAEDDDSTAPKPSNVASWEATPEGKKVRKVS